MNSLALADIQTIETAQDLHAQIMAALTAPAPIQVDASQVGQIDTASLQLLAALWRTSARTGTTPILKQPSPEFRRVAGLLGLAGLFGLDT